MVTTTIKKKAILGLKEGYEDIKQEIEDKIKKGLVLDVQYALGEFSTFLRVIEDLEELLK